MAVGQKSMYFKDNATPTEYREHQVRAAGTEHYYLFLGAPGFFGGALNQMNPARLKVTGKGFADGTSVRFRFQYDKDATVDAQSRVVTASSEGFQDLGVDKTVLLADLPSDDDDENGIIDVPLPYFADLEGANCIRVSVTGAGTFTAGDFDAYFDLTPNPVTNAGHDSVSREGYSSQPSFQNFNDGRIN